MSIHTEKIQTLWKDMKKIQTKIMEKRQTLWKPSRVFALECWLPQDHLPWWIPWIKLLSNNKLLKEVFKAVVQIKCPMYLKVQVTIAISVQCPTHKMTKLHLDQNQDYRRIFFCDKRMINWSLKNTWWLWWLWWSPKDMVTEVNSWKSRREELSKLTEKLTS